jgi:hypothetical protein
MNHRQPGASSIAALPTLLSAVALAVALAALLGPRAQPASASSLVAQIGPAAALGGGFSYQGSLSQSGRPVSGADACDMRFSLWDAASAGTQVGGSQTLAGVDFDRGLFAVTVNEGGQFGASAFAGEARWLQVEAACPASGAHRASCWAGTAARGRPPRPPSAGTRSSTARPRSTRDRSRRCGPRARVARRSLVAAPASSRCFPTRTGRARRWC